MLRVQPFLDEDDMRFLPLFLLILFIACHGAGRREFRVENRVLERGEVLCIVGPATGDVVVSSGFGSTSETLRSAEGRIACDWPKDPGLFFLRVEHAGLVTAMLVRVLVRGDLRIVDLITQETAERPSRDDEDLWRRFSADLIDDDLDRMLELKLPAWIGAVPPGSPGFVVVPAAGSWSPLVLAAGPGASGLDPATLQSLLAEMIDIAASPSGTMSAAEGARLHRMARRIVRAVDCTSAAKGMLRGDRECLPTGHGQASVNEWLHQAEHALTLGSTVQVEEVAGAESWAVWLRLARPVAAPRR